MNYAKEGKGRKYAIPNKGREDIQRKERDGRMHGEAPRSRREKGRRGG